MQGLSLGKADEGGSSESWQIISNNAANSNSSPAMDAQSNSEDSRRWKQENQAQMSGAELDSDEYLSMFSEETNRTETAKIKKDLCKSKLSKLDLIETRFKEDIEFFDRAGLCTICQYTFGECSSRMVILKCGHYFHERCFVLGVATLNECDWECAICRKDAITGKRKVTTTRVENPFGTSNNSRSSLVTCSRCMQKFYKGTEFDQHLKNSGHHNGRKYACRVCKSVWMTHFELMQHVMSIGHNSGALR